MMITHRDNTIINYIASMITPKIRDIRCDTPKIDKHSDTPKIVIYTIIQLYRIE
jgi:hypothetical protein